VTERPLPQSSILNPQSADLRASKPDLRPMAGAATYHDLPLLKPPVWTWEIPAYFFLGGAAGISAVLAVAAQAAGTNPQLVRDARRIAAIGANLSGPLLISDLGRPERFLNMLRIFKPQSPMSVGAWTLAAFGAASTVTAIADAKEWKLVAGTAGVAAAATGLVMATYTGVLLGATAIPIWSKHHRLLPVHFGASALGSAVSILELSGHRDAALNALGLGASIFETAVDHTLEDDAVKKPMPSRLAAALSGPVPLALRILGANSKRARQAAALCTLAGSLLTRHTWIRAGKTSASDPRAAASLPHC
jgi:hypothetical protein